MAELTRRPEVLYTVFDHAWEASFLSIESHELLKGNAKQVGSRDDWEINLSLMFEILSVRLSYKQKGDLDLSLKERLLVYCRGYIYLCERNVVCQFGKGIDISYLAKEFRATRVNKSAEPDQKYHEPDDSASQREEHCGGGKQEMGT